MKKLRITVEGKTYDVTVQVLEDDEATVTGAGFVSPLPLPAPRAAAPVVPPQSTAVANGAAPTAQPATRMPAGQADAILAPIAGTVQKVFVQAGGTIEAQAPVVMLDAMKMDTYIYAPRAMTITEVSVEIGASVQVGDPLVRFSLRD
jgi:glutaconyl-CoA/methylmalonyl-CoA decarboxylase subunit gamma